MTDSLTHLGGPGILPAVAESARLTRLYESGLLRSSADPTFDRFARIAAGLLRVPVAYVSMVGLDEQLTPGMVRHDDPSDDRRSIRTEDSFCQYAVSTGEPLAIDDVQTDVLSRDTALAARGEVGAYLGIPLSTSGGDLLGTLCVVDRGPRSWTDEEVRLLGDLTVTVEQEIEHRRREVQLLGSRGEARQVVDGVDRLSEAARSLIESAESFGDARLLRYAAVTASRLDTVRKLARDLRETAADDDGPSSAGSASIDLRRAVEQSVISVRTATRTSALELGDVPAAEQRVRGDALAVEASLTHLLITALHRSSPEGVVRTVMSSEGAAGAVELTVHAPTARLTGAELARVVARLHDAAAAAPTAGGARDAAALRMAGGAVTARSGPVRGSVSGEGTTVTVRWLLLRA